MAGVKGYRYPGNLKFKYVKFKPLAQAVLSCLHGQDLLCCCVSFECLASAARMQTIYSGSHPEPGVVVFPSQREPDVEQGATPPSRAQDVVAEVETAERKCDPSQEHPLDVTSPSYLSARAVIFSADELCGTARRAS
eukprot:953115-Rhodomonas_salina.1